MLEISKDAKERLAAFFKDRPGETVRIYVNDQAVGGPSLALMFDGKADADEQFQIGGTTYIIDRQLMADAQTIRIDSGPAGIAFHSRLKLGDDGCGCGCGCSD
jgi:Fe-S cluster assembly iron-binding protein IscA